MLLGLLAAFSSTARASYSVQLLGAENSTCAADTPRYGHVLMDAAPCSPAASISEVCADEVHPGKVLAITKVCIESLSDLWFDHAVLSTYEAGDSNCTEGTEATMRIVALGLCQENATVTCLGGVFAIDIYDNAECTGTPVETKSESTDTCLVPESSMYSVPVTISCTVAPLNKKRSERAGRFVYPEGEEARKEAYQTFMHADRSV